MGKMKRKFESGAATNYISRNQALKKLQLPLADFRRLCILKGIYPHEPRHVKKANKGSTASKTFYLRKDIQFLLHEPLIDKFRQFKVFIRKYKKAINKKDKERASTLKSNKPRYILDNIVKERYPTFIDAVRDLDDCLSMVHLFSIFPSTKRTHGNIIKSCRRLSVEFMNYVISSHSLRKVFVSIKGYYYQAEIMGEKVNWIVPHPLPYEHPEDVDYRIMQTFTEFYITLLGFVNYKLYNSLNLHYPPKVAVDDKDEGDWDDAVDGRSICNRSEKFLERLASLSYPLLKATDAPDAPENSELSDMHELLKEESQEKADIVLEEEKKRENTKNLFKGLKIFLNREVAREPLAFVIRSCGGQVSWDSTAAPGATFSEEDESITYHVIDRPSLSPMRVNRSYVQPQWVFDSLNKGELLDVKSYLIGADLPPHLSPFVVYDEYSYIPPEARPEGEEEKLSDIEEDDEEDDVKNEDQSDSDDEDEAEDDEEVDEDDEELSGNESDNENSEESTVDEPKEKKTKMSVSRGVVRKQLSKAEIEDQEKREHLKLSEMMASKKHRHVYKKIMFGKKRLQKEKRILQEKRDEIDKLKKKRNKGKNN
ncbi:DgyrCDS11323 [Dimorphilus gyrociliatus]|uniref:Pescadillo homolog n=1 Tax=Dimorphilus gyrociliatus TaxID=2664684 RepID=A0A7I8W494_9ANNE|nr:DgyrCDS11323 [Dimorphilus gyrociliatus]